MQTAETNGEAQVLEMAKKVRAAGFDKAADEMEIFAKQEGHHGVLMAEIRDKYKPQSKITIKAVKLYENGFMTHPFALGGNGETAKRVEADDMKLDAPNVVRTDFTDGAYKNFERDSRGRRAALHHSRRRHLHR